MIFKLFEKVSSGDGSENKWQCLLCISVLVK